ncbi:MAG: hypothetical protein R3C17_22155 [Planctomycetaceae bacterium]
MADSAAGRANATHAGTSASRVPPLLKQLLLKQVPLKQLLF